MVVNKKYKMSDSESSMPYKHCKNDKYLDMRDSSLDKLKHHNNSHHSSEKIEMDIQRLI